MFYKSKKAPFLLNAERYSSLPLHPNIKSPPGAITDRLQLNTLYNSILVTYFLNAFEKEKNNMNGFNSIFACNELLKEKNYPLLHWDAVAKLYTPIPENIFELAKENETLPDVTVLKEIMKGTY